MSVVAGGGDMGKATALLEAGAMVNHVDVDGTSVLCCAIKCSANVALVEVRGETLLEAEL